MKRLVGILFLGISVVARPQDLPVHQLHSPHLPHVVSFKDTLTRLSNRGATISEVMGTSQVHPEHGDSAIVQASGYVLVLPVGINSPGKDGTYFRTDASIANNGAFDQDIGIAWLPDGVSGAGTGMEYFSLTANTIYTIRDFLESGDLRIDKAGVGSVVIFSFLTGTSTLDVGAHLDASFRVWTYEPSSSGTTSFTITPTTPMTLPTAERATALGLRQDAGFRTNVGIMNMDTVPHTWSIRVAGWDEAQADMTFSVTVLPVSMVQVPVPASFSPGYFFLEATPDTGGFLWSAYGVSADNLTGDAWFAQAIQE